MSPSQIFWLFNFKRYSHVIITNNYLKISKKYIELIQTEWRKAFNFRNAENKGFPSIA